MYYDLNENPPKRLLTKKLALDCLRQISGISRSETCPDVDQLLIDNLILEYVEPVYTATLQQLDGNIIQNGSVCTEGIVSISLADAKTKAKHVIRSYRDETIKDYNSRLIIYQPNYDAAKAVLNGTDDIFEMPDGTTASSYAIQMATAMGYADKTAWSNFIMGEWEILGSAVRAMEAEYCRLTYNAITGIDAHVTVSDINSTVDMFIATFGV